MLTVKAQIIIMYKTEEQKTLFKLNKRCICNSNNSQKSSVLVMHKFFCNL